MGLEAPAEHHGEKDAMPAEHHGEQDAITVMKAAHMVCPVAMVLQRTMYGTQKNFRMKNVLVNKLRNKMKFCRL